MSEIAEASQSEYSPDSETRAEALFVKESDKVNEKTPKAQGVVNKIRGMKTKAQKFVIGAIGVSFLAGCSAADMQRPQQPDPAEGFTIALYEGNLAADVQESPTAAANSFEPISNDLSAEQDVVSSIDFEDTLPADPVITEQLPVEEVAHIVSSDPMLISIPEEPTHLDNSTGAQLYEADDQIGTTESTLDQAENNPNQEIFVPHANLYLERLAKIETNQPLEEACGPAAVANALNLYYTSKGRWLDNRFNAEVTSTIYNNGTSEVGLNALTKNGLGENLRSGTYTIDEVESLAYAVGLEVHNLGARSTEGVEESLLVMSEFNTEETLGAYGIFHYDYKIAGSEGNHFAVIIPEGSEDNLTLTILDSYNPAIDNLENYASIANFEQVTIYDESGDPIGISINVGSRFAEFQEATSLNSIYAIPVLDESIISGMPPNMLAIEELAYGPLEN